MLAPPKGERLSWNDEGGKKSGRGPAGFASAGVSTETQNSGRNSPCGGDAGLKPGPGCHIIWRCAHDTWRRWRAPVHAEDICQRKAPTKPASVRRGLLVPRGSFFSDCGENVTRVKLLESEVENKKKGKKLWKNSN